MPQPRSKSKSKRARAAQAVDPAEAVAGAKAV